MGIHSIRYFRQCVTEAALITTSDNQPLAIQMENNK